MLDALLRLAEPGAILVEEAAATFLARHFDLAPVGGAGAAGPVHRLVAAERPGSHRGRRPPTFVGRARELGLLWSRLEDALRGHGQVVGLLGEAGIGKSRLLHEFRDRLLGESEQRVTFLEGRCQSYASAIPYFPILDVLRSNFRIAEGESPDAIADKIRAGVQDVGIEPAGAIPYVLRLFGISEGTEAPHRADDLSRQGADLRGAPPAHPERGPPAADPVRRRGSPLDRLHVGGVLHHLDGQHGGAAGDGHRRPIGRATGRRGWTARTSPRSRSRRCRGRTA